MLLHLPLPPFPFSTFSSTMKPSVLSAAFLLTLLCPCTLWTAWSRKIVEYLPGFDGPLPFYLETGYIEVDEEQGANLFYHFVKSEKNPEEDPLIFHIDGGPGCSLFNGFALQIGPVRFDVDSYDGGSTPKLVHWPETWTTFSSIIFVDWPVGTGYSFARGDMMDAWSDTKGSELLYVFIKEWALEHPEFASNPFYLSGMSFGGKMVPIVVQKIIDGNEAGETPFFNLKGYLAGNPITTDARYDEDTKVDFARGMGLISDELYKDIKKTCGDNMGFAENPTCMKYLNAFQKNLAGIHPSNILDPACGLDDPLSRRSIYTERYELEIEKSSLSSLLVSKKQCREYVYILSKIWSDNVAVQEALGVSKEWRGNWLRCNHYIKQEFSFDIPSPVPYYFNITNKGIWGLVYSGDHDLKANFIGTQAWMSTFDFPITSEWRSWKAIGQVSGYTRSYAGKLSYATVKAAGHVAPIYKPKECKVMVERWILGEVL